MLPDGAFLAYTRHRARVLATSGPNARNSIQTCRLSEQGVKDRVVTEWFGISCRPAYPRRS